MDHHVREHLAHLPEGMEPKSKHTLPLTGAQLTRMSTYRQFRSMLGRTPSTEEERLEEARLWSDAFSEAGAVGLEQKHKQLCFKIAYQA